MTEAEARAHRWKWLTNQIDLFSDLYNMNPKEVLETPISILNSVRMRRSERAEAREQEEKKNKMRN